ncbi:MAG: DNA recombination protein RmuC [Pseudomonadota bacterium]|nr:DNA recombination protein RmuC [Pseudomonadota bacterium]|tara:strand:- start:380 stop:1438 length:1059 start_codon:yes stop_codon:yes gene_type:complete
MNLELILAFIVGAIIGGGITFKLLPGFLKSIFRETARDELSEIQNQISDDNKQNEDDLSKRLEALNTAIIKASSTWDANTKNLAQEVGDLTKSHTQWAEALSNPGQQGALAEESLKVMLETAGFVKGVNFSEQQSEKTDQGDYRPDVYVNTPDQGTIIIDSKAPMKLYKEAIEIEDENLKKSKLKDHAKNVLDHAKKLGKKDYSGAIGKKTPDFVIMYMPNVSIYMSAIEQIPDLVEQAAKHRVMICPPSLVYAALKTIMLTWQQQEVYENAENIKQQASEVHARLKKFNDDFFSKIGTDLGRAIKSYNDGVRSWESRLMPSVRKIEEMGIADSTRKIEAPEEKQEIPIEKD